MALSTSPRLFYHLKLLLQSFESLPQRIRHLLQRPFQYPSIWSVYSRKERSDQPLVSLVRCQLRRRGLDGELSEIFSLTIVHSSSASSHRRRHVRCLRKYPDDHGDEELRRSSQYHLEPLQQSHEVLVRILATRQSSKQLCVQRSDRPQ